MTMPIDIWYRDVVNKKGDNKMNNNEKTLNVEIIPSILNEAHCRMGRTICNFENVARVLYAYQPEPAKCENSDISCVVADIDILLSEVLYANKLLADTLRHFTGNEMPCDAKPKMQEPNDRDGTSFSACLVSVDYTLDFALARAAELNDTICVVIYGVPHSDAANEPDEEGVTIAPPINLVDAVEKIKHLEHFSTMIYSAFVSTEGEMA